MCGIYGHFDPQGADPALIERMAACLSHRGPDGFGTHHAGTLAFGAGRLAIIDLKAGVQPIFSEDHRVAVVYNGEIYNYKALRGELEANGHHFSTRTDTEVLVHGYEQWGADVIERLRGMFALGIWDAGRERLLLARDRLGEKPLYYAQVEATFLFASEAKALFEWPGLRRAVNEDALLQYLTLGYVPPPLTMFAGVEKLAPGEFMLLDSDGYQKRRYWRAQMPPPAEISYDDATRQVRATLEAAVEMRLMSDVPIGAYLSGGLDSTAIVALMSHMISEPVRTFTVGFDFSDHPTADAKFNSDARYAALAAERLGTKHHAITLKQDERLAELFPHLVFAMDEPVSEQAIVQTAFVAALARQNGVPVLLSGDAGDELFAGYTHYRADGQLGRFLRIPRWLRASLLRRFAERYGGPGVAGLDDPTARYLKWMRKFAPDELPGLLSNGKLASHAYSAAQYILAPLLEERHGRPFADRIAYTSLNLWIAEDSNMRVDKMSMLMSTEARAPFEDHELVNLALSLPLNYKLRAGDFKAVLKSAVTDVVPHEILQRPKWGFTPPASEWLRTALRPLVQTYLSPERVAATGFFDPQAVWQLVEAHWAKESYQLQPLWTLLVFHIWYALYIDESLSLTYKLTPADMLPDIRVG